MPIHHSICPSTAARSDTFSPVLPEAESGQKFLEAAYCLYYTFWGKNLDEILQPVPDNGNFKHLTQTQITSLGMKERLLYPGEVLLVREVYHVLYQDIRSYEKSGSGVALTGQPGIGKCFLPHNITTQLLNPGKTCFLYYLLLRLLQEQRTVAFQVRDKFILFQPTGVQIYDVNSDFGYFIPEGAWALTDSCTGSTIPCSAFLVACKAGRACIVQTTPPSRDMWRWCEKRSAHVCWMDVFPLDELIALG